MKARRKQGRSGLAVIQACCGGSGGMLPLENFEEISALRAIFLHFDSPAGPLLLTLLRLIAIFTKKRKHCYYNSLDT